MAFEDAFPVFAQGPRTDLTWGYLNATINNTTVTVTSSETSRGFNLARTGVGAYTITFPKCKFCSIVAKFLPTAAANGLVPRLLAGIDPTTGSASLELSATAAGAASEPAAANNELELIFLLGF